MLNLRNFSLSRGNKLLLKDVNVQLHEKQKIGLIGHNGCGKSSLFSAIVGNITPDTGECAINTHLRISTLSQQLPDSTETALNFVLAGDEEYIALIQKLKDAQASHLDEQIFHLHEALTQTQGYSKPAKAAAILAGLGFSHDEQHLPVNHFSGGWRMRLSLARCLIKPADLLLLDEPTNHLDMEAIFWLERFLKQSPASVLLISHDRDFLDAFVSHILHIGNQTATLYTGNYSSFEKIRAEQLALSEALFEKQQTKIAHMMSFVNRFKAKATKAKQAQSRLKAIEKMEVVTLAQADSPFNFEFFPCERATNPLILCDNINAGYAEDSPILKQVKLSLNLGDRIALLGPNGEGKSTLIKTLTGILSPLSGTILQSSHLKIGYYAQHQLETLDLHLSPIETIQKLSKDIKEQQIRDYLGGFDFRGDMATKSIEHFSGGEKARLALAKLVFQKPNVLLLDEPTNHLDLNMRAAIEIALQQFEGAIVLISHDRHMLASSVDTFYLVSNQKVQPFQGDLDDYAIWLQTHNSAKDTTTPALSQNQHKEKKALKNRLKILEQHIEKGHVDLKQLDELLANPDLYTIEAEKKCKELQEKRAKLLHSLVAAEEEWMEVGQALEE